MTPNRDVISSHLSIEKLLKQAAHFTNATRLLERQAGFLSRQCFARNSLPFAIFHMSIVGHRAPNADQEP